MTEGDPAFVRCLCGVSWLCITREHSIIAIVSGRRERTSRTNVGGRTCVRQKDEDRQNNKDDRRVDV